MDPTTPSTARMIDHWLGGTHHLEVDVAAARAFEGVYGPCAHEFRSLREFLGRSVAYLVEGGVNDFLVLGAGIPTMGNVHEVAPGANVLYTDLDPVTVELGQEVLRGNPRAHYALADATGAIDTEPLTGWDDGPAGIVFLGLAAFLADDVLTATLTRLHEAAPPNSLLAFDFDSEELAAHPEALAFMGPDFHMRAPESFEALLGPWQLIAPIRPVATWPGAGPEHAAFYGSVARA